MNLKRRGLLIVFEGVDRSGKSTQVQKLESYLQNNKKEQTEKIRFPDRTTLSGKQLNEILSSQKAMHVKASHLLFSFNRWEKRQDILNLLEKGINVICDRYAFSGVVYSLTQGLDFKWCIQADQGLLRPDIVFQLDIDIDKSKTREGFGEEIYEKEDFQKKIQKNFKLFEKYLYWNIIDADRDIDTIHNDVVNRLEQLIKNYENSNNDSNDSDNSFRNKINEDLFTIEEYI